MSDLEQFTEFLFEGEQGYIYAPTLNRDTNTWTPKFFLWPSEKDKLHDWIRSEAHASDSYISPVVWKTKNSATKDNVKSSSVVWVEFDGQKEIDYRDIPEPNLVVQTSDTAHRHCYWKIPRIENGEAIEDTNRRLTYYFSADSSGHDITQVLRPPETINHKPDRNKSVVKTVQTVLSTFELSAFDKAPSIERPVIHIDYENLPQPDEVLKRYKLPSILSDRVTKELPTGDRSGFIYATANLLVENGVKNHADLVSLLYLIDTRVRKFAGRQDQLIRLSEIASLAILKHQVVVEIYSPTEILSHTDPHIPLIGKWLHTRGHMMIYGPAGIGKSQLAYWIGALLSGGQPIFEMETKQSSMLFISLEMGLADCQYILRHQSRDYDDPKQVDQFLKTVYPEEFSIPWMTALIEKLHPAVVVIDTLSEIADDLWSSKEAISTMRTFRKIREKLGVAFIFLHHNRKENNSNKKPNKLSDMYGAVEWGTKSETVISLWQEKEDGPIEVIGTKVRFGAKSNFEIVRSQNLTFHKIEAKKPQENPLLGLE